MLTILSSILAACLPHNIPQLIATAVFSEVVKAGVRRLLKE